MTDLPKMVAAMLPVCQRPAILKAIVFYILKDSSYSDFYFQLSTVISKNYKVEDFLNEDFATMFTEQYRIYRQKIQMISLTDVGVML